MKRPDLKPNKLYTESEMAENFTSAVLQGIAMCMTALEWHKKWRGKRLLKLAAEDAKSLFEACEKEYMRHDSFIEPEMCKFCKYYRTGFCKCEPDGRCRWRYDDEMKGRIEDG